MMVVNFAYDKTYKEYEIDDPDWGGMTLTLPQTRRFVDLIRRTHPELLEEKKEPKAKKVQEGTPSREGMRGGRPPHTAITIRAIIGESKRGMTLDQITENFQGTASKRAIQAALQGMVGSGEVVREPYWRDMRVPVFRMKKEGEGTKEKERGDQR